MDGAEIKSCCRLSALLGLPLKPAAQNVVPVAVTASESMDRLQTWASGRCLSASHSGIYQQPNGSANTRRRVNREPVKNGGRSQTRILYMLDGLPAWVAVQLFSFHRRINMTSVLDEPRLQTSSSASDRLRSTMAAARLSFNWPFRRSRTRSSGVS